MINNRFDGSVNYARSWSEYVGGFGNKQTEYWLGKITDLYQKLLRTVENFDFYVISE